MTTDRKPHTDIPVHLAFDKSFSRNTILKNNDDFIVNLIDCDLNSRCHVHHFFEIEILLEGNADIQIDNTEFSARRGSCWFCLPGTIHDVDITDKPKLLSIKFNENTIGGAINRFIASKSNFFVTDFCEEELQNIHGSFNMALDVARQNAELSRLALKGFLQFLVALIMQKSNKDVAEGKSDINPSVLKAIVYTKLHITEPITLKQMSEKLGYTPNYFSKIFKREIGKNYNAYLTEERLRIANILLKNSDLSISEISKQTGFETSAYFCRVYKKVFGKTPTQYKTV